MPLRRQNFTEISMKNRFLFILATHGDEGFSLSLIKNLEKKFPKEKFGYDWIIGNPKALEQKRRFIETDLNRCAPGNLNSQIYEEKRAAEIIEVASDYDFIVDIHGSASNCGIITIITYPTLQNLILASSLGIKRNVIWYAKSSLKKGPLTQFVKCPSVEIECGPQNNENIRKKLSKTLREFIIAQNNKKNLINVLKNLPKREFFVVYGKKEGNSNQKVTDFEQTEIDGEKFHPFLANQYPGILCYKTKKVNIEDYFLY